MVSDNDSNIKDEGHRAGLAALACQSEQTHISPTDETFASQGSSPSIWSYYYASRAHVVIDADAYFEVLNEAMLAARQRIMLIGWDFDTRILISGGRRWWHRSRRRRHPARFGAFIVWLARRRDGRKRASRLSVYILRWNFGALKILLRGTMLLDLLRWAWNRRICFRLDSAHPLGCSHHQKLVVLDDQLAACGGIDMTGARWDTTEHLDDDPRRCGPNGKRYGPWHDLTMLVEGRVAAALGDIARERWLLAGGAPLAPCDFHHATVWPERLVAEFHDCEIGIARTRAAWGGQPAIREVEALFIEHIARARHFIYIENQYFASRSIADAIARRLAEPEPPEILLVTADHALSFMQRSAMDTARIRLLESLRAIDHAQRLSAHVPVTKLGTPIYVHAKLMIVDDEILRVGSANLNNRSMGLDSECDLFLDAARPANTHVSGAISRLRHRLLAEHCGMKEDVVRDMLKAGTSMAMIAATASQERKRLQPLVLRPLSETEKALADKGLLDPENPDEVFGRGGTRKGLFRVGSLLSRPLDPLVPSNVTKNMGRKQQDHEKY